MSNKSLSHRFGILVVCAFILSALPGTQAWAARPEGQEHRASPIQAAPSSLQSNSGPMALRQDALARLASARLAPILPATSKAIAPASSAGSALIAITAAGFEPSAITVEAGTKVAWKNETTHTQLLKSGEPYTLYLPLVLRQASGGGSPPTARGFR